MKRLTITLAATALLAAVGAGCDPGPSCDGTLLEKDSRDPVPPSWTRQGVTFGPASMVCAGASDRDVVVVERTTDTVAARASRVRDELMGTGWAVVPGKEGPSGSGSYNVILERGAEALVVTVFPVSDPASKPALAIILGIVPKRTPAP